MATTRNLICQHTVWTPHCDACNAALSAGDIPREEMEAVVAFKRFYAAYVAACEKADAAFTRYFLKRCAGERTNGAAVAKLENGASYISADLAAAANHLYSMDIDPQKIEPEYQP